MAIVGLCDKPLLPKSEWRFQTAAAADADYILAGIYEYPPRCMYWAKAPLADLPNQLITLDDLARFGITLKGA